MLRIVTLYWLFLAALPAADSDYLLIAGSFRLCSFSWARESFSPLGEITLPQGIAPEQMRVRLEVDGQQRATWFGTAHSRVIVIEYWLSYAEATKASLVVFQSRKKKDVGGRPYFERIALGQVMAEKGILRPQP